MFYEMFVVHYLLFVFILQFLSFEECFLILTDKYTIDEITLPFLKMNEKKVRTSITTSKKGNTPN